MNEIKKCPHCGWDAQIHIDVTNSCVDVKLLCNGCDAIFKCSMDLNGSQSIPNVVNECLTDVLERWNTRVEEPQEKKETRFERLLKEGQKVDKLVCYLAYRDKYKVESCESLICSECEFHDPETTIDYLLAPHED